MLIKYVYVVSFIIIWWSYSGYALILYIMAAYKKNNNIDSKINNNYVFTTIIVPTFNEQDFIKKKLENLLELSYPRDFLEILILDGGSTDQTKEIVGSYTLTNNHIFLLSSDERNGKIFDINKGLNKARGEIIVISDADAILSPNAIDVIAKNLQDMSVGVVGICTIPREEMCPQEEIEYWILNNKIKFLESKFSSAHSVIATCYGFRKGLINQFPEDAIADDVYVALKAQESGLKAIYTPEAVAHEFRVPRTKSIMIKHKLRKGIGFIHEFIYFKNMFFNPSLFGVIIYPTRILQLLVTPFSVILFLALTFYFLSIGSYSWVWVPIGLMGLSAILNSIGFSRIYHPPVHHSGSRIRGLVYQLLALIISNATLLATLITYHFSQKSSKYKKI